MWSDKGVVASLGEVNGRVGILETLQGQKILITGANGFLGQHLVARLKATGASIYTVSRHLPETADGIQGLQGDLTDSQWCQERIGGIRPDIIYHLASSSLGGQDARFVLPNFENDLRTTVNTLLAAHACGCRRVILVASLEEPVLDGRPITLASPYAAAKICGTFYGLLFHQIFGLPVTILRPLMVYGPGQKGHKIIPYAIQSLLRGEAPRLSSGVRPVDWVYVEDVITAFVTAAVSSEAAGAMIDLGSGDLVSVREVIETIQGLIEGAPLPCFGALPDRIQEVVRRADTETAFRILRWRATTPLAEGLSKTIQYYSKQVASQNVPV